MAYYRTCPACGCNLDPGERCDCMDKKKAAPAQRTPGTANMKEQILCLLYKTTVEVVKDDRA